MQRRELLMASAAAALLVSAPGAKAQLFRRNRDQTLRITGSGASFPAPLYLAWLRAYNAKTEGVHLDYQSVGSGAGITALTNRVVDFAASDSAMTDQQIAAVDGGVVILPMTAGEIVLAYNLAGISELKLPRSVYPAIFSGAITRWNDPAIVAANPGVTLPDQQITAVARSDGSGTTFVFTQHLAAVDDGFKDRVGVGTNVPWPRQPNFIAAPRNDGVTAIVNQTPGAIGYIEAFFANSVGLPVALLENRSGNFTKPDEISGKAAISSADFNTDDLRIWVTDPTDPRAYPITTLTWMLFFRKHGTPEVAAALQDFVKWAITDGQSMAAELGYVALPEELVNRVLAQVPLIG